MGKRIFVCCIDIKKPIKINDDDTKLVKFLKQYCQKERIKYLEKKYGFKK